MNAVDLIRRKRDGEALSTTELETLVRAYTAGDVPDYQMAAFLMAVLWRGMSPTETVGLTWAMTRSGAELRVREALSPVADKHSTGGVGDKVTLAVAPLVAACGLPMAKVSGRGLGHTGGTVDKLEALRGLRTAFERADLLAQLRHHDLVLAAQSRDLAPADGRMYALRDVTATVESVALIAASIMSKKLAIGPSHLLLDVKVGAGAFTKTRAEAQRLAETMVRIGEAAGVRTAALLTAMEQPLGRAVGNALEVAEAVTILRGSGPEDVTALCLHETAYLLAMAGLVASETEGLARAERALRDGSGLAKLAEVVAAQGGDPAQIEDTRRLPRAPCHEIVAAPRSGYITHIDAERVGRVCVRLGAGRLRQEDAVDHSVGLVLLAKVGDRVQAGEPLVEIHARDEAQMRAAHADVLAAYTWGDAETAPIPLVLGSVTIETLPPAPEP